mmetsp:Transcript_32047/g.56666  ORF Transcript_32047/g.56666 Transcript_32047/m.56666 type:complete len:1192 (+) Transcript_32047:129-3704(+)
MQLLGNGLAEACWSGARCESVPAEAAATLAMEGKLSADWKEWVTCLQAVLTEGLLPLFWLHCRRGQLSVPVASLAASLDAAGGPLPGASAATVAGQLAVACPDFVLVQNAGTDAASIALKVAALEQALARESASKVGQGAWCAGVVAKGFSLALPENPLQRLDGGQNQPRDAQGKRWRQAQGSFYVNVEAVQREIAKRKPQILKQIVTYAETHCTEDPPPFLNCDSVPDGCATVKNERPEAQTDAGTSSPKLDAGGVLSFLDDLQQNPKYRQQICHVERYAARPAQYLPFEDLRDKAGRPLLSEPVVDALRSQLGVDKLFTHQHAALGAVLGRRQHLCLTTGTSSGKSLAFALPILEDFRRDPNLRALIIFPTKALAQDQLGKLEKLFQAVCPRLGVCTFDGDTPKAERAGRLKNCHVFLTNPDMLHFTILANHRSWRLILENLRYVVLDEAHVYRATFGSHVALLLRRFRRVLHYYGTSPLFIACSATIENAAPFFTQLVGLQSESDVCVVDKDTAGRGERKFCLWNPPLLELPEGETVSREQQNARKRARYSEREGNGASPRLPPGVGYKTRSSPYEDAAWVLAEAMRRNYRTVCFMQVRTLVELVLHAASQHLEGCPALQSRLAAYRGGYSATDRRRLEQRIFTGDLLGVVATNALELGIDIGDLDVTIHVGVPPTVASVWQQAGRAGRRGRPSVAVLIAQDDPLSQHFCRCPAEFFQRTLEARLPDVGNTFTLRGHALCAAVELSPLSVQEAGAWLGPAVLPVLQECKREGRLIVHVERQRGKAAVAANADAGEEKLIHCQVRGKKAPKEEVSLRDIDPVQFQVLIRGDSSPLETLEQKMAFMKLHPGAVFLHQQRAYFVEELDLQARTAWVVPRDPKRIDYYTECREHSQVVLSGGGTSRDAVLPTAPARSVIRCGGVTHRWCMYGFRKKSKADNRILDQIDLSLPAVEYPTQAVWMDLPGSVLQPVAQAGHAVDRGGLHALEHAMISLAPLCCDIEASELTCQHTRRDSDPNRYLLLLLETQKGGSGSVAKVYERFELLLGRAVRLLEACPCDEGCPNCIVAPYCGEYNHGLDKTAALMIGRALGLNQQGVSHVQQIGNRERSRSRDRSLSSEPRGTGIGRERSRSRDPSPAARQFGCTTCCSTGLLPQAAGAVTPAGGRVPARVFTKRLKSGSLVKREPCLDLD